MNSAMAPERREEKMAGVSKKKSLCLVLRRVNIVMFTLFVLMIVVVVVVGHSSIRLVFCGFVIICYLYVPSMSYCSCCLLATGKSFVASA